MSEITKEELIERVAEVIDQPCDKCELEDNCDCIVRGIICPYEEKKAEKIIPIIVGEIRRELEEMPNPWRGIWIKGAGFDLSRQKIIEYLKERWEK